MNPIHYGQGDVGICGLAGRVSSFRIDTTCSQCLHKLAGVVIDPVPLAAPTSKRKPGY